MKNMTSIEKMDDKAIVDAVKVEASKTIAAESIVSKYSKPFDVTVKDNARLDAEKVAMAVKAAEMEIAEKNNGDANVTCHSEL
jgi:hypothetical protein